MSIPGVLRPCLSCGTASTGSRCPEHERAQSATRARGTPEERGYDAAWRRLSRRARALQNFCTRCGSGRHLSTDHTPQAWHRRLNGLAIRLQDVQVLCARCQSELGDARPGSRRYEEWETSHATQQG